MKKVAIITGTSSGIGKAIAKYYKEEGYYVVGLSRRDTKENVDESIEIDLTEIYLPKMIETLNKKFGGFQGDINVLINNAGIMPLEDFDNLDWTLTVNLRVPMMLAAGLEIKRGGHIINIASISGITGDPGVPVYSATKAGIINFTKSLAQRFAPYIRVNSISPGFFNTNLVEGDTPKDLIEKVPMKREAEPSEIIPVVNMIEKSPYMTGANIVIDGGLTA